MLEKPVNMSVYRLNVKILPQGKRDFQTPFLKNHKSQIGLVMLKHAPRADGKLPTELPGAF